MSVPTPGCGCRPKKPAHPSPTGDTLVFSGPNRVPDTTTSPAGRPSTPPRGQYSPTTPNRMMTSPVSPPSEPPPTPTHRPAPRGMLPRSRKLLRKEVIQPHLPVRLPCYDFVPIASPTFDRSLRNTG